MSARDDKSLADSTAAGSGLPVSDSEPNEALARAIARSRAKRAGRTANGSVSAAPRISTHKCHAHGCPLSVPPKFLFCARHWHMTRKALQNAIWNEYRVGQEERKDPSNRYLAIQRLCVSELAYRGSMGASHRAAAHQYAEQAEVFRQRAIAEGAGDPFEQLERRKKTVDGQLSLSFEASSDANGRA